MINGHNDVLELAKALGTDAKNIKLLDKDLRADWVVLRPLTARQQIRDLIAVLQRRWACTRVGISYSNGTLQAWKK